MVDSIEVVSERIAGIPSNHVQDQLPATIAADTNIRIGENSNIVFVSVGKSNIKQISNERKVAVSIFEKPFQLRIENWFILPRLGVPS